MRKIELLAPVGTMESLYAAVQNGADAVYLGGKAFGARAHAGNFSHEELIEAIHYCHTYNVKIYITINTLIYDFEVNDLIEYVDFLHQNNVDAVIVQDLGVMNLLRKTFPHLEIHASTQMHIHNQEGLNLLEDLGIKRAVLAREVTLEQIKTMKKNTSLDLEVFVYGALCISYSGQCLMSSLIGGRSGNRGECAQNCRLPYELIEIDQDTKRTIDTVGEYLLSPKDLNTLENIQELLDAGIDSLKIEGRMKRSEYVAVVVRLFRKAIDTYLLGERFVLTEEDTIELQKIFNRGFTKGHLFENKGNDLMNPIRPNHIGIEIGKVIQVTKYRVTIQLTEELRQGDGIRIVGSTDEGYMVNKLYKDGLFVNKGLPGEIVELDVKGKIEKDSIVLKTTDSEQIKRLQATYAKDTRKILIQGEITLHLNQSITLSLWDLDGNYISVQSDLPFEQAINQPLSEERIIQQISKMGDTAFLLEHLNVIMDHEGTISIKELNALRRNATSLLQETRLNQEQTFIRNDVTFDVKEIIEEPSLRVLVRTKEQLQAAIESGITTIYIQDLILYKNINLIDYPTITFIPVVPRINKYNPTISSKHVLISEIGSLNTYINNNDVTLYTDHSLNVVNHYTVAFLNELGVNTVTISHEMLKEDIELLIESFKKDFQSKPNLEMIVFDRTEMMITEYCPINMHYKDTKKVNCTLCKQSKKYALKDRKGEEYLLYGDSTCIMHIHHFRRLHLLQELNEIKEMGINHIRLNFTFESYEETKKIIDAYQNQWNDIPTTYYVEDWTAGYYKR